MTTAAPDPRILARSLFLAHYLAEFLTACAAAPLDVIVLKGAALAETVYSHPGLRDFRDIDILIRPADAPRAKALLESLGYAAAVVHWETLKAGQDCQADFAKETPGGPVIIELHTDLVNNDLLWKVVHVDLEGLWQRSETVTLAGVPARMLGPEDQILHLCLHLAGHYFDAPRSVQDIGEVCRAREINWDSLLRLAQHAHAAAIVWLGLRLSNAPVPPHIQATLAPCPLWRRRLLEEWTGSSETNDRRRFWFLLHLLDSPLSAPRVFIRALFPTRRWLADHYAPGVEPTPGHIWLLMAHARFLWQAVR